MKRGHRYLGASFERDFSRHWGGSPGDPPKQETQPRKTDEEVQREAQQERLQARRRGGRQRNVLTGGGESSAPTSSGSLGAAGASRTIG